MSHRIFISYSRQAARPHAVALHAALGQDLAYRDEEHLEYGEHFPTALFEAATQAELLVCLLDDTYMSSAFCKAELEIGLRAWELQVSRGGPGANIVILVPGITHSGVLHHLPPGLAELQWPQMSDTAKAADFVTRRLAQCEGKPIADLLGPHEYVKLRDTLYSTAAMPSRLSSESEQLVYGLPAMPQGGFFGRAATLGTMLTRLQSPQGPGRLALVSPGGGGKTRLALEFAWRYGTRFFPGGIVWLDASREDLREQQFYGLLCRLRPETPPLQDLREANVSLEDRLREVFESRREAGPVLWVVDNVPEPDQGGAPPELAEWVPVGAAPVAVVATSRLLLQPPGINMLVESLAQADAVRLLTQDVAGIADDEAEQIAALVGHWPLALDLLNRCFFSQAVLPEEFLELVQEGSGIAGVVDEVCQVLEGQVPAEALRGISGTLALSFERLSPDAQRLAMILGHYGSAPLPLAILKSLGLILAPPRARAALRMRNIIRGGDEEFLGNLHPLMADFLQARDDRGEALRDAASTLITVVGGIDPLQVSQWPHARVWAPLADQLLARHALIDQERLALADWLGRLRLAQGFYAEASRVLAASLGQLESGAPPNELRLLHARVLVRLGHAAEAIAQVEAISPDASEAVFCAGELEKAEALRRLSKLADAEECLRQLADREFLRTDARLNASWEFLLARVLLVRGMQLNEARTLAASARDWYFSADGPGSHEGLSGAHLLALVEMRLGHTGEAAVLAEELVTARHASLGPEHPDTLSARHLLAQVRRALGDWQSAAEIHEEVLELRRQVLGETHPATLDSLNDLGNAYWYLDQFRRARDLYQEAWQLQLEVLGAEHLSTVRSYGNLAVAELALGRLTVARQSFREVHARKIAILGPDHADTLTDLGNLAECAMAAQDFDEAVVLLDELIARNRRVRGPAHRNTLRARRWLAKTQILALELDLAAAGLDALEPEAIKALGAGHREVLFLRGVRGHLHVALEDSAAGYDLLTRLLRETQSIGLRKTHPEVVDWHWLLHHLKSLQESSELDEDLLLNRPEFDELIAARYPPEHWLHSPPRAQAPASAAEARDVNK